MNSSPIYNQNQLSNSYGFESNFEQQQRKEGLTTRLRQTINAAGKLVQGSLQRKTSEPDLSSLTSQSQVRILKKKRII